MSKYLIPYVKNPKGFLDPAWLFANKCDVKRENYIHTGDEIDYYIWVDDVGKAIVLVFQESDGKNDWKNNFRFAKTVYNHQQSVIKAHKGFVSVYKSANDDIMKAFIEQINSHSDYDVIICGWSMGGALSVLAAEDLNYRTRPEVERPESGVKPILVTFGAPQVLWGDDSVEYVKSCCSSIYNFSHIRDIVTQVPFWKWGYRIPRKIKIALKEKNPFLWFNPWHSHTHYYKEDYYDKVIEC